MDKQRVEQLEKFQQRLGYTFADTALLDTALTHTSYVKGDKRCLAHNERLEYLGDAVLELCVSEYLYKNHPECNEGVMTRVRSLTVYESALCEAAREIELGEALLLSRGESNSGGREKPSILSDAMEAVIGAAYLSGGMEAARKLVLRFAEPRIRTVMQGISTKDYKTQLQEYIRRERHESVEYTLIGESGPDHKKVFVLQCRSGGALLGQGEGNSKQEAGQRAARAALEALGQIT